MKKISTYFFLFIVLSIASHAQEGLDEIIEAEMKSAKHAFNLQEKSLTSEFTNNYDLKYHRLSWTIDPSELFIEGSVTSYFIPVGEDLSEIYFDLASGFTIDSVIFQEAAQTSCLDICVDFIH